MAGMTQKRALKTLFSLWSRDLMTWGLETTFGPLAIKRL